MSSEADENQRDPAEVEPEDEQRLIEDDVYEDELDDDEPDDEEQLDDAGDLEDDDDLDEDDDLAALDGEPQSPGAGLELEELVRYVASRLVQEPDEIEVASEYRGGTVYVSLRVPEAEMGRVIGREGRTAKAMRTLVSIAGSRQNVHARLDIDG